MPSSVEVSAWIEQQKISPLQILVFVLCTLASVLEGFDAQVIGYIAPAIATDLHIPPHEMTPVFVWGLVGLLLGCLVIAPLADWIGRKRIIVGSTIFFGLMSLATSWAPSLEAVVILRFVTGLGLGGSMPNAIAMTAEYFPARMRAIMTMAMFGVGFPLGAAGGGVLSAYLIPAYGWPAVFFVGGILPLVMAVFLVVLLPESIRHLASKGAATDKLAAILRRINPAQIFPPGTRFISTEERASGLTVIHLFREGRALGTVLIWIMFFMSLLDIFLLSSWLPTVLHDAGMSLSVSVVATALLQGAGVIFSLILGLAVDRFGFLAVLMPTYVGAAIAIAAIGFTGTDITLIMLAAFFSGAFVIGGQTGVNVLAAVFYPTYIRATGVGWGLGIGRVGSIVGPIVGGIMLQAHWDRSSIFLAAALPAFIVALAVFAMVQLAPSKIGRRTPAQSLPAE